MLEITFGILPDKLQAESINTSRFSRSPIVDAIGPDKPSHDIFRNFRFLRLPMEDGNFPEQAQSECQRFQCSEISN